MFPDPPQSRRAQLTLQEICLSTTLTRRITPVRSPAITGSWSFLLRPLLLAELLEASVWLYGNARCDGCSQVNVWRAELFRSSAASMSG